MEHDDIISEIIEEEGLADKSPAAEADEVAVHTWVEVADAHVNQIWICSNEDCDEDEDNRIVGVDPTFYENNGTPICSCGCDMAYLRTEVLEVK